MTDNENTLTTTQFSEKTGIPVSTVSRKLRQGKLRGEKRKGRWAIFASELPDSGIQPLGRDGESTAPSGGNENAQSATGKTYDVNGFARLTYLTEHGVRQWLRKGRLSGSTDSDGNVRVDASNLERPEFRHLVRK